MRTIQTIGVPAKGMIPDDVDAVVVALKTRSIAAKDAVAQSLDALRALQAAGCVRFFFKYCSTFDSTDAGNIGPVGDALLEALGAKQAIYCPAFPENGRTIFFGHLFVGDVLLSDSRMRHHPLNPMTDASLVRVLARQTRHKVGLVALKQVQAGSATLRAALDKLAADGVRACRGRCRGRYRSRHHRRGGRRRPAGHRRLGRGAGPARRLSPPRPAGAQGQCRHAAQDHRRRRRARGLVLGRDPGTDRGVQGPAPSSRYRRHLPRRSGRRQGAGLGQGQARQRTDPAVGQRQSGRGEGAAGEIRRREIEPGHREDHGGAGQGPGRRRRRAAWSWPAAKPRAPWSARST